jgi:hypothetical protein
MSSIREYPLEPPVGKHLPVVTRAAMVDVMTVYAAVNGDEEEAVVGCHG